VSGTLIVGLVASARTATESDAGSRSLLAVGVSPDERRRGLATAMLDRHLESFDGSIAWSATVTGAERDPVEPLDRSVRAGIARRLLERHRFDVQTGGGSLGRSDPEAVEAVRR
jgi:hypothetical protein